MSKASSWFVSDEEYDVATEDYAFVNESASWVKHGLAQNYAYLGDDHDLDDEYNDEGEKPLTFQDVTRSIISSGDSFGRNTATQLIYADVDGSNKEHQHILTRIARQEFVDEAPEKCKQASEKLINHLVQTSYDRHVERGGSTNLETYAKEKQEDTEVKLRSYRGRVSPRIVDYLIGLEEDADLEATLSVLSNQTLRKTYRPVMLLIAMIDKGSVEKPGSEGWAVAYDFRTNRITIKPYLFDHSHHPLAGKWDVEPPNDGTCFSGQPSDFVARLSQLEAAIQSKKAATSAVQYGFSIMIHYLVADWIYRHGNALTKIPAVGGKSAMTEEELEKVKEAMRAVLEESANIDFPKQIRQSTTRQQIDIFLHLQRELEDWEPTVRKQAIKAKEAGDEATANKAAELYELLWQQLQAFNMSLET
ncbi:MAG: hypothetical protein LQ346_004033 [Caloplaca aetnensis]|nr:MAG: hypothetical protein LQ346_004033 [Caloplaca aetnensis]